MALWKIPRVRLALCAALVAAAVLGACSILPEREPVQVWQPPESAATPTATPDANFSLRVDTPNTTGMLGDRGIMVLPAPGRVSTYKGARWSDAPALLVRQRLVDAFLAAGLPAVTTSDDRFAADFALSGDLRAFQSEYRAGSPVVVVRLDVQLRRAYTQRPLATHSFVVTQRPANAQVPAIVAAFGAANDQLGAEVVRWVIDQVRHAPAADPASMQERRRH